jgi:hypothetical protein
MGAVHKNGTVAFGKLRKCFDCPHNPSLKLQTREGIMSQEEKIVWVFLLAALLLVLGYGAYQMSAGPLAMH